ncbi:MAG: SpoIIE family protein phosphatase [Solirubrobacteraceae bacterium]|nr:SpoIIE family protein phosphatase [Solirubrobacteraceae bacterium]
MNTIRTPPFWPTGLVIGVIGALLGAVIQGIVARAVDAASFSSALGATVVVIIFAGFRPALVCALIGGVLSLLIVFTPGNGDSDDVARLVVFVIVSALVLVAGWLLDRLRARTAELLEREHATAQSLQRGLLPASLPETPGLDIATAYQPSTNGIDVGGDFYDVVDAGDRWVAFVGDVCGHGVEAAGRVALARHTFRARAGEDGPAVALNHVNHALLIDGGDPALTTMVAVELPRNAGEGAPCRYSSAGHPPPLLVREGAVRALAAHGPMLGVFEDPELPQRSFTLRPGDRVVLYTDGVTETRYDGELFGEERLHALLERVGDRQPAAIVAAIREAVEHFRGDLPRQDDLAVMVIAPARESRG